METRENISAVAIDLADKLTAISVISRLLARKLEAYSNSHQPMKGGMQNGQSPT